ncbi:MAG: class I SAM-dependent methyltransferase, partial [Stellaceae bacterium]
AIAMAIEGLRRLCPDISGRTFLDIGCGSGLSSLAALRLGATRVLATDIDENSVKTTRSVLSRYAPNGNWSVMECSVFELTPDDERFDVVYSWGVLHHTGAMWDAIARAAALVSEGGTLVIAIYRKTPLCGIWRIEKSIYSRLPYPLQTPIRLSYTALFSLGLLASGRNPVTYAREYVLKRGMRWQIDIHDWLGGYPYESAAADDIERFLNDRGFPHIDFHLASNVRLGGLFGSGCDEYSAKRG